MAEERPEMLPGAMGKPPPGGEGRVGRARGDPLCRDAEKNRKKFQKNCVTVYVTPDVTKTC